MDPISVSALVAVLSKVLDGAAGQVGGQLWQSLTSLVKRACRHDETRTAIDALPSRAEDSAAVDQLAEALVAEARENPAADTELRRWLAETTRTLNQSNVSNTVHGNVSGNVVQARDIHGDIRFG